MAKTITSANSVFMLAVANLYPVPQQLQGYAADAAFATDDIEPAETFMGVDGKMSAGFVPVAIPQTISLQADSDSILLFDAWLNAEKAAREIYYASAIISLPAIGREYTLTRGVLTRAKPLPDAKKTLQPVEYRITWESITPIPAIF